MLRAIGKALIVGLIVMVMGLNSNLVAQQITILPLTASSANSEFAVSPNSEGVTIISDGQHENDYLVVIDGNVESALLVTVGSDFAVDRQTLPGTYSLAMPIVRTANGEFSVTFVAIPSQDKGTNGETTATQQWAAANSSWASARFGWQDSLGDWLANNVLIPLVGVDNLANASDTTLLVGTTVVVGATVFTGAIAIEVALTGTVTWGSGAAAGGAGAGGGAAAAGGTATAIPEGTGLVGWVIGDEIAAVSIPNISHAALGVECGAIVDGVVVEGAYAVSIIKSGGEIVVVGSSNFGGILSVPTAVINIVKAAFM